jgi:hypothetical protein
MDHLRRIIGRVDKPWLIPLADRLLRELAGTVEFSGCPSETAAAAGLIGQCRPGFEGIVLWKAAGSTCARLLATIQEGGFSGRQIDIGEPVSSFAEVLVFESVH